MDSDGSNLFIGDLKRLYIGVDNMANAYSDDANYVTVNNATNGDVTIYLSKDGGVNWTSGITETMPTGSGAEAVVTWGDGSTEQWGTSWTGDDVDDTSFRLKISINGDSQEYGIYKTMGFSILSSYIVVGIEVAVKGYYASNLSYVNHIKAKIYYGNSAIPTQPGSQAYASDGRKNGEGAGAGTGVLVFRDATAWRACDTGATVAA
jgi:hypothetical protein